MQSVTSNAVYNAVHQVNYIQPIPAYNRFAYIIPEGRVLNYYDVGGKTVVVVVAVYRYAPKFIVQVSFGTTDAYVQQLCGDGRNGFQTVTETSPENFLDEYFKYFAFRISVPAGNNCFGIGTTYASIGVADFHFE